MQKTSYKLLLPILITLSALGIALLLYFSQYIFGHSFLVSPLGSSSQPVSLSKIFEKPLEKYTVLNLGNRQSEISQIIKEKVLTEDAVYTSYLVSFTSDKKKVTAMMNVPLGEGPFPVIVMFRGYVDPTIYQTGIGTQRAADVFAKNGFITFAPDFFGYGGSSTQSANIMEERFQTYTVALDALSSVPNLDKADSGKVGIWAHSNGGQIAITVLEATQKNYPTVLWAPVTKPFPYSVLYYTDEAEDRGKFLRKELSKFENDYNADLYSITDYLDRIEAPIQLHQGSSDEAVPQRWSDEFDKTLTKLNKDITYYTYPGADHNLMPSWNTVVERNIQFFNNHLK